MSDPNTQSEAPASDDATHAHAGEPSRTRAADPTQPREVPQAHPERVGEYRVEELLGAGGMGFVYKARDERANRSVAVKTMRTELVAQPGAADRFLREARTAAAVEHDNVVPIWQVGEDANGPFIVMPLLKGAPLNEVLSACGLPLVVGLRVARETALGLAAAHAAGLVHRDIKPGNLWVEGDPAAADWAERVRRVRVLDFGLARPVSAAHELSASGAIVGTASYMSPEQGRGLPVDARTDLWSLGVLLYRLCTGRMPFTGGDIMGVLTSIAVDQPPSLEEVDAALPPALSDLVVRLLQKNRDLRPNSAALVAVELKAIIDALTGTLPVDAPDLSAFANFSKADAEATESTEPSGRTPGAPSKRTLAPVIAALVLAAVGSAALLAIMVSQMKKPDEPPPDPAKNDPKPTDNGKDNGAPPAPKPNGDERAAAAMEWVRSVSGRLQYREPVQPGTTPPPAPIAVTFSPAARTIPFGDEQFAGLADLPTLRGVYVSEMPVTNAALPHLGKLVRLESLHLMGTAVDGDGLKHLHGLKELTYLDLRKTKVTPEQARALAAALPKCHIDVDGLSIKPVPAATGDRAAAEWVLGTAFGSVQVRTNTGEKSLRAKDALPDGDLRLLSATVPSATDAALARFTGLQHLALLNISGAAVTDAGLAHLKNLPALETLHLFAPINGTGLTHLRALPGLRTLTLGSKSLNPSSLKHLAGSPVQQLSLNDTPFDETGVKHLSALTGLRVLGLNRTRVKDADVRGLSALDALVELDLSGNDVTGAALANGAPRRLFKLSLANTRTGDASLDAVAKLGDLESLDLTGCTGVTDAGLERLAQVPNLVGLSLKGTKVTKEGVDKLFKARPACAISWDGGLTKPVRPERDAALWVLSKGGRVQVRDRAALRWVDAANNLPPHTVVQSVAFDNVAALADADLARLRAFPNLVGVSLSLSGTADSGLALLSELKGLEFLSLEGTKITDAGMQHLAGLTNLKRLIVSQTAVGDAGFAHLKGLTRLESLDVTSTKLTDAGVAHLTGLTELKVLSLTNTKLTERALAQLNVLTKLENLSVRDTQVGDAGLSHLSGLVKLDWLYLSRTGVTDAGLAHLKGLKALRLLWLDGNQGVTDAGLEQLAGLTELRTLLVTDTKITAEGVAKLKKALPTCKIDWIAPKK